MRVVFLIRINRHLDICPNRRGTQHTHTISKESLERLERENNVKRLHRQSIKTNDSSPKMRPQHNSHELLYSRPEQPPALVFVKEDEDQPGLHIDGDDIFLGNTAKTDPSAQADTLEGSPR